MTSGHFSLQPIFDYVRTVPRLPERDKLDASPYGKYQLAAKDLLKDVPNLPGWYVWSKPGSQKPVIYVGKSDKGLYNRFVNRFNQEYTVLWEAVWGPHPLIEDAYAMFQSPTYRRKIENDRCKAAATHIIWIAKDRIETEECDQVERELMTIFKTYPCCNKKCGPVNGIYRETAIEVADRFRRTIDQLA